MSDFKLTSNTNNTSSDSTDGTLAPTPAVEPSRKRIYFSTQKIKDIRLVPVTDRNYWQIVQTTRYNMGEGEKLAEFKQHSEVDIHAKLGRFGEHMEKVVQAWLRGFFEMSENRALLFSPRSNRSQTYSNCALEIDGVAMLNGNPDILFEIKCGFRGSQVREAERQLIRRAEVLAYKHPQIRCASIFVSCNPNHERSNDSIYVNSSLRLEVPKLREKLLGDKIPVITIEADPLIEFANSIGLPFDLELTTAYNAKRKELIDNRAAGVVIYPQGAD